eukprot:Skav217057  [mRNA]  locus=scaffold208:136990:141312:+ [translate_table: standard]
MASQHCINHGGLLVPDQPLEPNWITKQKQNVTIQADVHHLKSIQTIAFTGAKLWTGSFPCQPFSGSAHARGLLDPNGHAFVQMMTLARKMRPPIIALENVKNFKDHPHHGTAVKIIHWSGYRIIYEKILNIQDRLPIQRPRWLCILQRLEDQPMEHDWMTWGEAIHRRPMDWDAWMTTPEEDAITFLPTKEAWTMYMDPNLLPDRPPYYARENMLRYRVPPLQQKLPVVMAMYGSQHDLPSSLIQSKGLHGFLTTENSKPRFWKPAELALLHTQCEPLALLRPVQLSWKAIGNSIVLHHAFVVATNALACIHVKPAAFDLPTAVAFIEENRLKASTLSQVTDEYGWCIASSQEMAENMNQRIKHMSHAMGWTSEKPPTWPAESYYHPQHGCCHVTTDQPTPTTHEDFQMHPTMAFTVQADDHVSDSDHDTQPPNEFLNRWHQQCHSEPPDTTLLDPEEDDQSIDSPASTNAISATLPMQDDPMTTDDWADVALFIIPGTYGILKVSSDFKFDDLLRLWKYKLFPASLMESPSQLPCVLAQHVTSTMLFPRWLAHQELPDTTDADQCIQDRLMESPRRSIILMSTDTGTYAMLSHNITWDELTCQFHELPNVAYTEWGLVEPRAVLNQHVRLHNHPQETQCFVDMVSLLESIDQIEVYHQFPATTDILVVHLQGPTEALSVVATLWHIALDTTWQALHGRQVSFQATDQNHVRFIFRPDGRAYATPILLLEPTIAAKLGKSMLQSLHDPQAPNKIRIKDFHGIMCTIGISHQHQIRDIFKCLQHAFTAFAHGETPRIICTGKQIHQETLPEDIFAKKSDVIGHLVMPLRGGTGGAKRDHKRTIQSTLAGLLIEHGVKLEDVPFYAEQLQTQFGLPKLTHVVFTSNEDEKLKQFNTMCKHASVPIQSAGTPTEAVKHKFQKIAAKKVNTVTQIDPKLYALTPGFFKTKAGADLPIHQTFSPCVSGITMLTTDQAEPWLVPNQKLHADEKAIFVVGNLPITQLQSQKIVVPAENTKGQPCLISGYIIQLGERDVTWMDASDTVIQTHDVQICSFTLWMEDWTPAEWKAIQEAPVKQARRILEADGVKFTMNTPFGRTYHNDQVPCAPEKSTSIQFHSEVRIGELRALLRHSGFNGVYIVPKGEDARPSSAWKVVWSDQPKRTLETMVMTNPHVAGLVRGRKTFGVRCDAKHFEDLWKIFHGDQEVPPTAPTGDLYKVQNVPYGVDRKVLSEWLEACGWEAFPVKSVGSRAWLLKAKSGPPRDILCFNTQPVIIRRMQQKSYNHTGLIAGPRSNSTPTEAPQQQRNAYKLGDPFYDPWKPPQSGPAQNPVAPPAQGPTMAHLTKHDQQIAALESAIQQVQETQKTTTQHIEHRIGQVESTVAQHADATQQTLHAFQKEFNESFKAALSQNDKKMQDTLDELKDLFIRSKRKTHPGEAPEDDEDM